MSRYLEFYVGEQKAKTKVINVESKTRGDVLGEIKWFGRWRQYVFFPEPGTVFNVECLNDIMDKIKELMNERRK